MSWTLFITTIFMLISVCEGLLFGTLDLTPRVLTILSDGAIFVMDFCYSNIQVEDLNQMTRDILINLLEVLRDLVREVAANCLPENSEIAAELFRLSMAIAAFIWELGGR